jgi:hypothetical protein
MVQAAAEKVGEGFQPRAGELSEGVYPGWSNSGSPPALRIIPPPSPILPSEVANLAYFARTSRVTLLRPEFFPVMSSRA